MDIVFLILGVLGLWLGTELTVRGASRIAKRLNWSELFIGLTILAFGTDLPELAVAMKGAINNYHGIDSSGVIVGNAIGSSICQISIVLGIAAILHYLRVGKIQIRFIAVELIGSILLLVIVAIDGVLTWNDGAILVISFFIYILTNFQREKKRRQKKQEKPLPASGAVFSQIMILLIGLLIVGFSSELTIDIALGIADSWGVGQTFVGAILLGLGTSLPELAISVNAVVKKKTDLSVGNVMGSNIFDLLIPTGVSSLIADISIDPQILAFDIPTLFLISIIVLWFLQRKRGIQRWEGIVLVQLYIIYAILKFWL